MSHVASRHAETLGFSGQDTRVYHLHDPSLPETLVPNPAPVEGPLRVPQPMRSGSGFEGSICPFSALSHKAFTEGSSLPDFDMRWRWGVFGMMY